MILSVTRIPTDKEELIGVMQTAPVTKHPRRQEPEGRGCDSWARKIPWRRHGNPFQYSCLENPIDRGAWWTESMGS